jgi:acylphosphatase
MFVIEEARHLDLKKWIRNRSDDTVELTAEGEREDLEQLVFALREGPHLATVSHVETTYSSVSGEFKQFWYLETY